MSAGCGNSRKSASGVAPPHLPIQRPDDDFAKADSPSLQILPGPEEPDWHLEEDATVVPGDRLSAVLGTDGEQLRRYGALDMTSAKYAQDNGGFATIEIVRFPDLTRA
ncbi:MAG TPA: hypothetical protein VEZ11_12020, partial [Thermoanaerobaculia bacterium]|nr:hypothetical protein [Thermoanaerobaculia bacterium]